MTFDVYLIDRVLNGTSERRVARGVERWCDEKVGLTLHVS